MRFYRNHYKAEDFTSRGYAFFSSKEGARRRWVELGQDNVPHHTRASMAVPVDIEPTRKGILEALQALASHPDNG